MEMEERGDQVTRMGQSHDPESRNLYLFSYKTPPLYRIYVSGQIQLPLPRSICVLL